MSEYTRGQEREEKRRISAGVRTSVFACLLCWVPFLGVILASAGVVKVFGTITRRYQKKFRVGAAVSLIVQLLFYRENLLAVKKRILRGIFGRKSC